MLSRHFIAFVIEVLIYSKNKHFKRYTIFLSFYRLYLCIRRCSPKIVCKEGLNKEKNIQESSRIMRLSGQEWAQVVDFIRRNCLFTIFGLGIQTKLKCEWLYLRSCAGRMRVCGRSLMISDDSSIYQILFYKSLVNKSI